MDIVEAIVLGITQGLTEFLPISSSGHLILVPWLFNWEQNGLAFDAALHLGTLTAVFAYFWHDILRMIQAVPIALREPLTTLRYDAEAGAAASDETAANRTFGKLGLLIVLASIPGGAVGLLAQGAIEEFFHDDDHVDRSVLSVAVLLTAFAIVLLVAERRGSKSRGLASICPRDAFAIGCAQAIALLPGVSRSGITISAGLFRGIRRADAARFSFLLGVPLVTIAGLKGVADIAQSSPDGRELVTLAAGMMSAAVSGLFAIWGLLRFLQQSSTVIFVAYRLMAGIGVILLVASGAK
ncbi:undecaprenyl-diphosphate phosphatase [soil metagenome]